MILLLADLTTLCVYDGCCLAHAFELDGGIDCGFALEGTMEGTRFAPFCPLYTIFGVDISMGGENCRSARSVNRPRIDRSRGGGTLHGRL